jgi:hypothetical protein
VRRARARRGELRGSLEERRREDPQRCAAVAVTHATGVLRLEVGIVEVGALAVLVHVSPPRGGLERSFDTT